MDIEIRLFGPVEVVTPSGRLSSSDFPSRKAKQVLQVLALAAGRVVSKDRLIDLLWRRRMPRNPAATVELAVSLLRSALATVTDAALVVTAPGGYRLDTALVDIDTGRFDELLQLSAESPADGRMTMLAEAVRLADRPLFEDELGAEWVVNDRERFRVKSQSAALELGRQALAVDDATLAFSMAERARSGTEFVVEEAYALGVAALVQLGRRHQARQLLVELEQRLSDEEARALSIESMALRSLIDTPTAPQPGAVIAVPASLSAVPEPLPFLGRVDEMSSAVRDVQHLLVADTGGMLLVDGPSGGGVSRFLLELRERCAELDGVSVFAIAGSAADQAHPMLAIGHLVRALVRRSKSRKSVPVDESVASMFSRVAELLDAAGPVVLVVDDADLLDAPSAAVLRALLSPGAVSGCCLVVGASGTTAVESVEAWPVTAASSRVSLQPLNESELAALAVDNLWALVGGHPATLVACVSAAHRDGVLSPAEIARVVHQVGDLGDLGRAALVVLARSGRPTRSTDLAHALHVSQSTAADLLRRAVQLGVARGTVRYGHELVGDVLAEVLRADSAVHPH